MHKNMEIKDKSFVPPKPSIYIRNAIKTFPPANVVLNGLNLTVPEGTIYGLLGASGCGKTTLLNCIAGRETLDAGSIDLAIKKRSEMGFMPQTLSLHEQLTVIENFFFYGYLFGLSSKDVAIRSQGLTKFLEIPAEERLVRELSGGQQRRVSIAVTLIHDPKILILDEPTVGLDPVISHSIWQHLLAMAKNGKTIVLTTNYIQEAQHAHTIGLMRNGVLLAEESPLRLLQRSNSDSLEEAFLMLSEQQEGMEYKQSVCNVTNNTRKPVKSHFEDDCIFRFSKFKGIMYKNLTSLRRDYVYLIVQFFIPFVNTIMFNLTVGTKPTHLPLGVVNNEIPVAHCNSTLYKGCFLHNDFVPLSCLFLEYMKNQTYNFIEYDDYESGLNEVRKNNVWALLQFPQNYTKSLAHKVEDGINVDGDVLVHGFVNTWLDLSDAYIGNFIKYDMIRSMSSFFQEALSNCGINPHLGKDYITFEEPVYGSVNENFISYASVALLCLCCFYFPLFSTAMLSFLEKVEGISERMMIAGVSAVEIITSLILIQLAVHVIQTTIVMSVLYLVYNNPMEGSLFTLCMLMLITGTSGMLYGFMLSVICNTVFLTGYGASGLNFILCTTSGLLWPAEGAHKIIRSLNWLSPLSWTVDAARVICLKNFPFTHPVVLRGFGSAITWNITFLFLIYWFIRLQKGRLTGRK